MLGILAYLDPVAVAVIAIGAAVMVAAWELGWESIFVEEPYLYQRHRLTGARRYRQIAPAGPTDDPDCVWLKWKGV